MAEAASRVGGVILKADPVPVDTNIGSRLCAQDKRKVEGERSVVAAEFYKKLRVVL